MIIQDFKNIFSAVTTFTASTISTFASGTDYEFISNGKKENYPLLYMEEDYSINNPELNGSRPIETWNFGLLVVDQLHMQNSKISKDNIKDAMLEEARNIIAYLNNKLKENFKGATVQSAGYLSLNDFEQDNVHGWRLDISVITPSGEPKCNPFQDEENI